MSKLFYREEDGHTYEFLKDGLIGYPTFVDGTPDFEHGVYCKDMDIEPDEEDRIYAFVLGQI